MGRQKFKADENLGRPFLADKVAVYWNSFVMSPDLIRGDTGGLEN